jgi:lipoprotein-anchoring transpeptidase ErfK/SrfK
MEYMPLLSSRPVGRFVAVLVVTVALGLTGCGRSPSPHWNSPGGANTNDGGKVSASITAPGSGATDVPAAIEITYRTSNAKSASVQLTDASGGGVDGAPRPDGSSWVPSHSLKYTTKYTVKVTATGADGKTADATVSFTTMAAPGNTSHMNSNMGDNQVYGVGAPVVLTFTKSIPQSARAAVQKRLFVESTPAQDGAWNWFSDKEVHFRPKEFWQTGTKVSVRALFRGVPLGDGLYGDDDLTIDASIVTSALRIDVDDATKKLTVTQDGKVIKSIPASLGKASTPSSSGNMVIMTRAEQEVFDSSTNGIPVNSPGGYRETVYYTLRLTWDGQYIHAAPWSTNAQGSYDVSHGCTNISMDDAKWLYGIVHIGDPVTVKNTGAPLPWTDGWTDWDRGFEEYVKGSAIPYAPQAATPHPSTS